MSRRYHWPNPPPSPDVPYSYQSHSDDLVQYLRRRPYPAHLVGHSYGAGVVLLTALRQPSLVQSLVLIEPAVASLLAAGPAGLDEERASRNALVAAVRTLADAGQDDAAARALIDWTQGVRDGFARLAPAVQQGLLDNAKTIGPMFATAPTAIGRDELGRLGVPTLVVSGGRTRLYYRLIAQAIASSVPRARSARISAAAHMTIVERPDETAALIDSFLTGQSQAKGSRGEE